MKKKTKIILGIFGGAATSFSLVALGYGLHKAIITDKIDKMIEEHRKKEIEAGKLSNKLDCLIMENEYEPDVLGYIQGESCSAYREEYSEQKVIKVLNELK